MIMHKQLTDIRHQLRIAGLYLRVSIMHELQYRVHLAMQLVQTGVQLATAFIGLGVVFAHGDSLNGWTADELLVVVAMFMVVSGMIGAFIQPGLKLLMEQVRKGTLDFTLLMPQDAQFLVSVQRIDPWKLVDVAAGAVLLVVAAVRLPGTIEPLVVGQFLLLTVAGLTCVYSAWIALSTLTFWFIRAGELLDIARTAFDAGRWPVNLYPSWLRHGLTFIVPSGFGVSVPATALTGSVSAQQTLVAVGYAALALLMSRALWKVALRRYSGASA